MDLAQKLTWSRSNGPATTALQLNAGANQTALTVYVSLFGLVTDRCCLCSTMVDRVMHDRVISSVITGSTAVVLAYQIILIDNLTRTIDSPSNSACSLDIWMLCWHDQTRKANP